MTASPLLPLSILNQLAPTDADPRPVLLTIAGPTAVGKTALCVQLARQLGTTWNTLWSQVQPVLAQAAGDPSRLEGVQVLGVDEHI